ncbi:hypothetical protein G3O00_01825 [Burkholderia sp. Ac-20384]|uniref:phage baseplate protein n=1 Tax=Burkholderia sp. Ac-20384 TaxID=2703902 RepID=UPI001981083A|nr:hypothetical protein [Burkholderia sp. Ac-20384]MBN3822355.1 hypothetical protein [Burkholderia sp. Ac-20384]
MILDMITISPKKIGSIRVQVAIEEVYNDELTITEHPVEKGAEITDHAFKRQPDVVMRCGWSNSDYEALLGAAEATFDGGSLPSAQYVNAIYSQLLALQQARTPFDVTTSRRLYQNMLLQGLRLTTDPKTSSALVLMATLKQIRIVSTQATKLPPREDQADPASTAETGNGGVKAAVPATPAPGGSVPPESM